MKKYLLKIMSVLLLSSLLQMVFVGVLFASESGVQQGKITITGKVISGDDNLGLPGTNVIIKGTTVGTVTNFDGIYSLEVPDENATLVFSSIGFMNEEILVGSQRVIDVTMLMDIKSLGEVVVVGYGTQQAKEVTGSISSVSSKDITGLQVTGLDQALTGKMAGVQVAQNSGEPGGSVSIKIRGPGSINSGSEPLYIIDGVPYGNLNSINPNDIQRIDVLKDAASAAIYGSRASNGVVIVTTKKGRKGGISVDLDAYYGVQKIAKKLDLLDGPEFAKLANEYLTTPNPAWADPSKVLSTDWQDEILQTAPIQSYNISISGGSEKSTTRVSFGYFNQDGIIVGSDYKRYTARLNTDYNILDNLKVGVRVNTSFVNNNSVSSNDEYGGVLENASYAHPTSPVYADTEGLFGINPDGTVNPNGSEFYGWNGHAFVSTKADGGLYPAGVSNTKYAAESYNQKMKKSQSSIMAAFVEWEIIPGLSAKSSFNFTYDNGLSASGKGVAPSDIDQRGGFNTRSTYNENWTRGNQWNWINTISYKKEINNHTVSAVAGVDALKSYYQGVYVTTIEVPDVQRSINASDPLTRTVNGNPVEESLMSMFGRASYDYKKKYLASAIVRRDGSSKFGPDSRWAVFPSVSAGWRISEENFMESLTFIDELKVRASYGEVGNQNIDNFQYLNSFINRQLVGDHKFPYNYTLGADKHIVGAYYANTIGVPDIHWEKSIMKNFGVDAIFLNHKFTLTAEYYIKTLDDLLGKFPTPLYTGVYGGEIGDDNGTVLKNGFSMENRGFELAVGYNEHIGDFNFSVNGNFSTLNNKILKLSGDENGVSQTISNYSRPSTNDGTPYTLTKVGESIANFYGYVTDGIAQTQEDIDNSGMSKIELGDRLYKDINGDGIIDSKDRVALGDGMPDYTFGLSLKADYKGFDFSMLFDGQAGVEIANVFKFTRYNMLHYEGKGLVNVSTDLLDSWSPTNTNTDLPRNSEGAPTSNRWFSDFNVEDGSFVRIKNIQLGYTLPESVSKKAGMTRTRVYVSAQNLLTITGYSGYDPEVGSRGSVLETGVDRGRYPSSKMFIVGTQITF